MTQQLNEKINILCMQNNKVNEKINIQTLLSKSVRNIFPIKGSLINTVSLNYTDSMMKIAVLEIKYK
ncbi:hypothetical protein NAL19_2417 [Pectobacterium sp. F1-1]|nr:hypothetical protein NAL19_2417 [Pectobacterium sp. F1-1]